jgi:uncharacterized protein YajQ (UPF0234 family)
MMPSFDVVSQVDMQEIDNAVNQTRKEVEQRYDFKGTHTEILLEKNEIKIVTVDDFKLKAVVEVLQSKMARRQVPLKSLTYAAVEPASGGRSRQTVTVQQGIATEKARQIVKLIKDSKIRVQAQIQADQVRVSGKNRDDLQRVIQLLKQTELDVALQFVNFRE